MEENNRLCKRSRPGMRLRYPGGRQILKGNQFLLDCARKMDGPLRAHRDRQCEIFDSVRLQFPLPLPVLRSSKSQEVVCSPTFLTCFHPANRHKTFLFPQLQIASLLRAIHKKTRSHRKSCTIRRQPNHTLSWEN